MRLEIFSYLIEKRIVSPSEGEEKENSLHPFRLCMKIIFAVPESHQQTREIGEREANTRSIAHIKFLHGLPIRLCNGTFPAGLFGKIDDCLKKDPLDQQPQKEEREKKGNTNMGAVNRYRLLEMLLQLVQILSMSPVRRKHWRRLQAMPILCPKQRYCKSGLVTLIISCLSDEIGLEPLICTYAKTFSFSSR
jgi:hypothetical protein